MEKQRADDRKRLLDNPRRIDLLEAQVREQTRESMDYSRAKCMEVHGRIRDVDVCLRAELDDKFSKLLGTLEAKSKEHTDGVVKDIEAKTADRIKFVEDALKAQEI